jgi:hypothetical protein
MKLPSSNLPTFIYVKLQVGSDLVFGRSFHLDYLVKDTSGSKEGACDE